MTKKQIEKALGRKLAPCKHWHSAKRGGQYFMDCLNPMKDDFCPAWAWCPAKREEYEQEANKAKAQKEGR